MVCACALSSLLFVRVHSMKDDLNLKPSVCIWQQNCQNAKMKLMLIDGTAQYCVVRAPYRLKITDNWPCLQKSWYLSLFVYAMTSTSCRVHYQRGSLLCPRGHRWCPETFSSADSQRGSLAVLYFLFSHLSKKHNKRKERWGLLAEKQRQTGGQERGVQGGEMKG